MAFCVIGLIANEVVAQEVAVDPVIVEPIRPLFSDDEVDIPTVGVGCGQLSLAPLLFGWPAFLLMSVHSPNSRSKKCISS